MPELPEFMSKKLRKQLIFRSWHRGTREMDLLLGSFADQNIPGFSDTELEEYARILELSDMDLYNWITGQEEVPGDLMGKLFQRLIDHKFASQT
ncbi:MAG: FAD assembly factor SdhE [Alphaproteobacteria bacterium]